MTEWHGSAGDSTLFMLLSYLPNPPLAEGWDGLAAGGVGGGWGREAVLADVVGQLDDAVAPQVGEALVE